MTKKDYVAIAEILRNNTFSDDFGNRYCLCQDLVKDFCLYFKQDNPRFNKEKFMEAVCGE